MGLAAGQARLLTITARKSDCEFQSMRLSHQKIALARELADISNEYQNSLDQTKLIYDYYGTGDTNTPLSYSLMMTPSALNEFTPITLTDSMNRVVLNSKYAKAAEAAGIPREGLGTLPSDSMRNAFIQGLAGAGLITNSLSETIQGIPYNQGAGFGGGTSVAVTTQQGNFDKFCDYLINSGINVDLSLDKNGKVDHKNYGIKVTYNDNKNKAVEEWNADSDVNSKSWNFNLGELLKGDTQVALWASSDRGYNTDNCGKYVQSVLDMFIDQVAEQLGDVLNLGDGYTETAFQYATSKFKENFLPVDENGDYISQFTDPEIFNRNTGNDSHSYYVGWCCYKHWHAGSDHRHSRNGVDLNNLLKAYLTYFADFMNGLSKTDLNGEQVFDAEKGAVSSNHLCDKNDTFEYVWKVGTSVSSDDLKLATFYDTLFNQICANGWTEDNNVLDNEYLQQMLQGGMMYISRQSEDNFYYQGNYATDNYIKVVADETLIAQAEAKYTTEKAKLNAKEETLDLKMKNLDTEISSLTTEYDTVKNTISKNIEKSFKRYDA